MAADFACETIDPQNPDGPKVKAVFPAALTLYYYKFQPVRYENLRAAKFVLEHPARIFFGVREFNEGGWCYTAKPRHWYIKADKVVPFPDGEVYAVYLNPLMRVYECRAEFAADEDPVCPANWENRYRGLTWKDTF